jgi:ParB family chromosome partitioning protein
MARAAKNKAKSKTSTKKKRKGAEPGSRGMEAAALAGEDPPNSVTELADAIHSDGGSVLGIYRDPLGGAWQLLAGLPLDKVAPTPFQRDLSPTHAKRLTGVIDKIGRFLDPVIAVRRDDGQYWTPNGYHRMSAMQNLGAKSIVALVVPEQEVAYKILALNTEKAHNLREKCLEVIRMARELAKLDARPEREFALEFEEPGFVTLGCCYEERGRMAGGAYNPVLRRVESFLEDPLPAALEVRARRAAKLLELDDAVSAAVDMLKERGFDSPYLKAFVVARVNPLRFKRGATGEFDEIIDKMTASARDFDPGKVKAEQVARSAGAPDE